jgi:hypothetical protein
MSLARAIAMTAAVALIAAAPARADNAATAPLAQRLADTASGFCVDILSRTVPVPGVASPTYARYGLTEGLPQEAMTALGRQGVSLISGATLASGTAKDGDFIVALGGAAGGTCRLIVYKAPPGGLPDAQVADRMLATSAGWRTVPATSASTAVRKLSFFKRDAARRPYLANVLTPVTPGPIAMTVTVAAIPPTVVLPQGF